MSYYPVFLDLKGKRCLVVGGGEVAYRKALSLLDAGAQVRVISPELCAELSRLAAAGAITALQRRYLDGDLKDAFLAVAATDERDINEAIVSEARERRVLVNVVDNAALSDFIVPSSLRRGDITLSVSTGGRSPALARKIRTMLENHLPEEYGALATLVDEVRNELKQAGNNTDGEAWQKALDIEAMLQLLRSGDRDRARSLLLDNLKKARVS